MSCNVMIDLKAIGTAFALSPKGYSATLLCEFSGHYKLENKVQIELVVSKAASSGRPLDVYTSELNELICTGTILRVAGQLEKIAYQEREGGREVEKLRLFAYRVEPSNETEPVYSVATIIGKVKLRDTVAGGVSFFVSVVPKEENARSAFLNILVGANGDKLVRRVTKMNLNEKSYIQAIGKLEASSATGLLFLRLHEVDYAKFPKRKEVVKNEVA